MRFGAIALGLLLHAPPAEASPFPPREVLRIDAIAVDAPPKVRLFVTDLDEQGRPRPMTVDRPYKLQVNSLPVESSPRVKSVSESGEPLSLTFVVQLGPSMSPVLEITKKRLNEIVSGISQSSRIRVIGYANEIVNDSKATTPAEARSAIEALAIRSDALEMQLAAAVELALTPVPKEPETHQLMAVISDGTSSELNQDKFTKLGYRARERKVRIASVGFAPFDDVPRKATLAVLSKKSNGTERVAQNEAEFGDAMAALSDEIRHQRVLEYALPHLFVGEFKEFQLGVANLASEPIRLIVPKHELESTGPWKAVLVGIGLALGMIGIGVGLMGFRKRQKKAAEAVMKQLQEQPKAAPDLGKTTPGLRISPQKERIKIHPLPEERPDRWKGKEKNEEKPKPSRKKPESKPEQPKLPKLEPPKRKEPEPAWKEPEPSEETEAPTIAVSPIRSDRISEPIRSIPDPARSERISIPDHDTSPTDPPPALKPFALPRPTEFLRMMDPSRDQGPQPTQVRDVDLESTETMKTSELLPKVDPEPSVLDEPIKPASIWPSAPSRDPRQSAQRTQVLTSLDFDQVDVAGWLVPLPAGSPTLVLRNGFTIGGDDSSDHRVPLASGRPRHARFELGATGRWAVVIDKQARVLEDGDTIDVGGSTFLYKYATRFPTMREEGVPHLFVIGGLDDGRRIRLDQPKTIGSHPSASAVVRGEGIAPMHAIARVTGRTCEISDLGSGLTANGQTVATISLTPGQEVQLGGVRLVFRVPSEPVSS